MDTPIPGYQGLSDELTLGYIAWYTIRKPLITQDELAALVTKLGLDPKVVPPEPRVVDAFKRACRYSEQKGIPIPLSNNTGNILIRSVAQTPKEVERHMVLEEVDPQGRTLDYHSMIEFKFIRATDVLQVNRAKVERFEEIVDRALNTFMQNFKEATVYVDAQLVRRMIRDQLDRMMALPVRQQGSVYFIPQKEKARTLALEELCTALRRGVGGEGSAFYSLPLVDTRKQRQMVQSAFEEEIHNESAQLIADMKGISKELSPKAWAKYRTKLKHLQEKYKEYGGMVETEMSKASLELGVVEKQLTHLRVKV